jgi:DNA-binding NarL/FixJ family response regulator
MSTESDPARAPDNGTAPRLVVVVSRDHAFRGSLGSALSRAARDVVIGSDFECLSHIDGWAAEWRKLEEVEAVVIDLGPDIASGLAALDAVRRRDPYIFVIVLARNLGTEGAARFGAHLVLEGEVEPNAVVDALRARATQKTRTISTSETDSRR